MVERLAPLRGESGRMDEGKDGWLEGKRDGWSFFQVRLLRLIGSGITRSRGTEGVVTLARLPCTLGSNMF